MFNDHDPLQHLSLFFFFPSFRLTLLFYLLGLDDLLQHERRALVRDVAMCLAAEKGGNGGMVKQALSEQIHSQHPMSLFN